MRTKYKALLGALLFAAAASMSFSATTCPWRVSDGASYSALADSLLLVRYARGLRGASLIAGTGAIDALQVENQINARLPWLDLDGNGTLDLAETVALSRTLLGLPGGPQLPEGCDAGGVAAIPLQIIGVQNKAAVVWLSTVSTLLPNTGTQTQSQSNSAGVAYVPTSEFLTTLPDSGGRGSAVTRSPNAANALLDGRPVRGLTLVTPRVDMSVVSPATTVVDGLRSYGAMTVGQAESQVASSFAVTVADLYATSPSLRMYRLHSLLAAALAGYQDVSEQIFDTAGRNLAAARELAVARIMAQLPALFAAFGDAVNTYDDALAILVENGFFPPAAEIADAIVQKLEAEGGSAAAGAAAPAAALADPYCPEQNVGVSYKELGRMLLGSDEYRVGLDEQRVGVNQLFANSCNAVRNTDASIRSGAGGWHTGIDYQVRAGGDPVTERRTVPQYSVVDGTVVYVSASNPNGGTSNYGVVAVRDNRNAQRIWRYLHLDRIDVAVGDTVNIGCQIGLSGGTGTSRASFPVHVHIEVQEGSNVTGSGISNYQDARDAVLTLGFKNPRTLVDAFVEPHQRSCNQSLPVLNWRYSGAITVLAPQLIRTAGFNARGNIYVVNDQSVVSIHSPSTFGTIAANISPTPSDFGVAGPSLPSLVTTASFGAKLLLGANGARQIPIVDLDERRVIDRVPYAATGMGRTLRARDRAGYPQVLSISMAGDALAVGMGGTWSSDGASTVELLSFPEGVASNQYVTVAGGSCAGLVAYTSRVRLSGFVTHRCSNGDLVYVNATTLTTSTFANLGLQSSVTRIAVSKNGDKVLASTDNGYRKITLFNLQGTELGAPVVSSQIDFAGQFIDPLYPRFDDSGQRIYVQRYRDFQIYSLDGTLVQTIGYPSGVSGTPSTATSQMAFNATGTKLLIPTANRVLVYSLDP